MCSQSFGVGGIIGESSCDTLGTATGDCRLNSWNDDVHPEKESSNLIPPECLPRFDDNGIINFLFLRWVYHWLKPVSLGLYGLNELHPLPSSDRLSNWYPTLSKHISDGLLRLEASESGFAPRRKFFKKFRPHRSILLRALFLTSWKRALIPLACVIMVNLLNIASTIILKNLLEMLSAKSLSFKSASWMIISIVVLEVVQSMTIRHVYFYTSRVDITVETALSVAIFQHGLCYRRCYSKLLENIGPPNMCENIIHSFLGNDSDCVQHPLLCPARRHQNRELSSSMHTYLAFDVYYVASIFGGIYVLLRFILGFIFGTILIRAQLGLDVLYPASIVVSIVVFMVFVEFVSGFILKYNLECTDYRISRSSEVLGKLGLLKMMGIEDVGYNIVENCRNDELYLLKKRALLLLTNISLNRIIGTVIYLVTLLDFFGRMAKQDGESSFDLTAPITLLHIIKKMVEPLEYFPRTLRTLVMAGRSLQRLEKFLRTCSPNFYLNYGGATSDAVVDNMDDKERLLCDTLVFLKDASFTLAYSREGILGPDSKHLIFKGINFVLRRGEVVFITGNRGSGMSSFIKAILGELCLAHGSMAVAPLSSGMPIFYASRDVWIPHGSIREIITFGYRFDEDIYKTVILSTELEIDISSWEESDARIVSEQGYSLSGGQRVRLGLARALYAYMIFSEENRLNGGKCCFLMCLDEPFGGLDPSVSKSILLNLFGSKGGLLVRDDIAVVASIGSLALDILTPSLSSGLICDLSIYAVVDGGITVFDPCKNSIDGYSSLSEKNSLEPSRMGISCSERMSLARLTNNALRSCNGLKVRAIGELSTVGSNSPSQSALSKDIGTKSDAFSMFGSYITYFSAMSFICFFLIVFLLLTSDVVTSVNSILVARWCDSLKGFSSGFEGGVGNLSDLKLKLIPIMRSVIVLSFLSIFFIFCGMFALLYASIRVSRRIHEYALSSTFNRESESLKVKNSVADLVTFLSADMYYVDECMIKYFSESLSAIQSCCTQVISLFYALPIIIPFIVLALFILYRRVLKIYFLAARKLQNMMLDSMSLTNSVYNNAMAGSAIYRSFRKEWECMDGVLEYTDYYLRVRFLKVASWASVMVITEVTMSVMILLVSFSYLIYCYVFEKELKAVYLGLGISLCSGFSSSFTNFLFSFSCFDRQMCCISRFRSYFLQGKTSFGDEKFDSGEVILSFEDAISEKDHSASDSVRRNALVRRRQEEFRNGYFRRYFSVFTSLSYNPKIPIVYVSAYLPCDHVAIQLHGVYVPQAPDAKDKYSGYILRNISCTAYASEIVGIIGRTGSGKSTLLHVLQNIIRSREGSVLLDGVDLNMIPRKVIRHIVGVLPQLPLVFRGWTVRRIIDPRMLYSDDEIMLVVRDCGLSDLVNNLPGGNGLDTVIIPDHFVRTEEGELSTTFRHKNRRGRQHRQSEVCPTSPRGSGNFGEDILSVSQLRMLSFLKLVLYRNSYRLLLVDEPPPEEYTDYGDPQLATFDAPEGINQGVPSEKCFSIYNLIGTYFKHCTTFIVAHDSNVLRLCTSVWAMAEGTIFRKYKTEKIIPNHSTFSIDKILSMRACYDTNTTN